MLNPHDISPHLDTWGAQFEIQCIDETGSTNSDLMSQTPTLTRPMMLIANKQTAGRGRAGRSWLSTGDNALTFSLAWPSQLNLRMLSGLSLMVGVSIAECLARLDVPVKLKWPNDILRDGKKLAGILIETNSRVDHAPSQTKQWLVIGIGLNLVMPPELEEKIGQAVADVPWLARMNRGHLLAQLINTLARHLNEFEQHGFAAFTDRWEQFHAHAGQLVHILDQGTVQHTGIALGVDAQGALRLATNDREICILSGDVSLRPA